MRRQIRRRVRAAPRRARPRSDGACTLATIAAGLVLTHSIAVRYFLHSSTDWQDEMSVFLLSGATFLSAPYVQSVRGISRSKRSEGFLPKPSSRSDSLGRRSASRSAPSSPGNPGCCCWKPSKRRGHRLRLGAAAVDSLFDDDGRHEPADAAVLVQLARPCSAGARPALIPLVIGLLYAGATLAPCSWACRSHSRSERSRSPSWLASAARVAEHGRAERLSGNRQRHAADDPAVHSERRAIGRSRAGADLYNALYIWLHRVPGGLGVANVFACTLFAAMAGSSAATCSAIGSAGIPEMRRAAIRRGCRRHHRRRRHARHPAAAVDHHDPLCGGRRTIARTAVPGRPRAGPAAERPVRGLRGAALSERVSRRRSLPASNTRSCAATVYTMAQRM